MYETRCGFVLGCVVYTVFRANFDLKIMLLLPIFWAAYFNIYSGSKLKGEI